MCMHAFLGDVGWKRSEVAFTALTCSLTRLSVCLLLRVSAASVPFIGGQDIFKILVSTHVHVCYVHFGRVGGDLREKARGLR